MSLGGTNNGELGFQFGSDVVTTKGNIEHVDNLMDVGSITITLNLKDSWTPEQIQDAYKKVNALNEAGNLVLVNNPEKRTRSFRRDYEKTFGKIAADQDLDHIKDLQLGGKNDPYTNASPLNSSVNRSFGPQTSNQLKGLPSGTRITKVLIRLNTIPEAKNILDESLYYRKPS